VAGISLGDSPFKLVPMDTSFTSVNKREKNKIKDILIRINI
jgi:hypothetical protein